MRGAAAILLADHAAWLAAADQSGPALRFGNDPAGRDDLRHTLRQRNPAAICLLAHVAGEKISELSMPALPRRDRLAYIRRRLAQQYDDTHFTCACPPPPRAPAGQPWQLLALPRAPLDPWLALFDDMTLPLAGLWSLSQLAGELRRLAHDLPDSGLLLFAHAEGVSQYLYRAGRIRLARHAGLAVLHDGAALAEEIRRLEQFLHTQPELAPDARLPAHLLIPADLPRVAANAGIHCHALPPLPELVGRLLASLASKPPTQQFAPAAHRRSYLAERRARRLGVAALALSGLLAAVGAWFWQQETALGQWPAEISPPASAPAEISIAPATADIHRLAESYRRIGAPPSQLALWRRLGKALEAAPGITLDELRWQEPRLLATGSVTDAAEFRHFLARLQADGQPAQVLRAPFGDHPIVGRLGESSPASATFVVQLPAAGQP